MKRKSRVLAFLFIITLLLTNCGVSNLHQTESSSEAKLRVSIDDNDFTVKCNLLIQKDSVISISFYLVKGIEIGRIQITHKAISFFNIVQRKYASLSIRKLNGITRPKLRFGHICRWISNSNDIASSDLQFHIGSHNVSMKLYTNTLSKINLKSIPITQYERVSLQEILKF